MCHKLLAITFTGHPVVEFIVSIYRTLFYGRTLDFVRTCQPGRKSSGTLLMLLMVLVAISATLSVDCPSSLHAQVRKTPRPLIKRPISQISISFSLFLSTWSLPLCQDFCQNRLRENMVATKLGLNCTPPFFQNPQVWYTPLISYLSSVLQLLVRVQ